jgi:hypothetical protein
MGQLMENPFWQAHATAATGLPPQLHGLIAQNTGQFNSITGDTIDQMRKTFAGAAAPQTTTQFGIRTNISAREQADAFAAEQLGMSVDEMKTLDKEARRGAIQGTMLDAGDQYKKSVREIQNLDVSDEKRIRLMEQLREGTGRYGGMETSWADLERLAGKKGSGIKQSEIDEIGELDPAKRSKAISKLISEKSPERNQRNREKTQIAFTGLAEKTLREVVGNQSFNARAKRAVNRGVESIHEGLGMTASGTNDISNLFEAGEAPPPDSPLIGPWSD